MYKGTRFLLNYQNIRYLKVYLLGLFRKNHLYVGVKWIIMLFGG
jgi:hypothetical protein